jgi:hypothetical protein
VKECEMREISNYIHRVLLEEKLAKMSFENLNKRLMK